MRGFARAERLYVCVRPRDARGVTGGDGDGSVGRSRRREHRSVVSAPRLYLPDSESEAEPKRGASSKGR